MNHKIEISFNSNSNKEFIIWDCEAALHIREKYRIVGQCIGTLPRAVSQNVDLGLPIILSYEEVFLLLCLNKVSSIVNDKVICNHPNAEWKESLLTEYKSYINENYKEISDCQKKRKRLYKSGYYDQIVTGLKKRKERLLKKSEKGASVSSEQWQECDRDVVDLATFTDATPDLSLKETMIHLPVDTPIWWLRPGEKQTYPLPTNFTDQLPDSITFSYSKMKTIAEFLYKLKFVENVDAPDLSTTSNIHDEQWQIFLSRCIVFCDLWRKEYFITVAGAAKLACDFLCYQGDPGVFHATHAVRVLLNESNLPITSLAASLRVTHSVKKIFLIVYVNYTDDCSVTYSSLKWTKSI